MAIRTYKNEAWQDIQSLKAVKDGVFADVPSVKIDAAGVKQEVYPTKPPILYLYKDGDECVNVTGGWNCLAMPGGILTKKADCINTYSYNGGNFGSIRVFTRNKIDTSGYKYLNVTKKTTTISYGYSLCWVYHYLLISASCPTDSNMWIKDDEKNLSYSAYDTSPLNVMEV